MALARPELRCAAFKLVVPYHGMGQNESPHTSSLGLVWRCSPPSQFPIDIPPSFFKVFYGVAFQVGSPYVLYSIAKVEPHMFDYLNTLYSGWMRGIMFRIVYSVFIHTPILG